MTEADDEIARLRRRLERERRARRQAESIADRGLRDLWTAHQQLRDSLATADRRRRREVGAAHDVEAARLELIRPAVDGSSWCALVGAPVSAVADLDRPPVWETLAPCEIGDAVVQRWQRCAALRSVLLSVDAPPVADGVTADWRRFTAIADVLCPAAIGWSVPGPLDVRIDVADRVVRLALPSPPPGAIGGAADTALAMAELLAGRGHGALESTSGGRVSVVLPVRWPDDPPTTA